MKLTEEQKHAIRGKKAKSQNRSLCKIQELSLNGLGAFVGWFNPFGDIVHESNVSTLSLTIVPNGWSDPYIELGLMNAVKAFVELTDQERDGVTMLKSRAVFHFGALIDAHLIYMTPSDVIDSIGRELVEVKASDKLYAVYALNLHRLPQEVQS